MYIFFWETSGLRFRPVLRCDFVSLPFGRSTERKPEAENFGVEFSENNNNNAGLTMKLELKLYLQSKILQAPQFTDFRKKFPKNEIF